MKHVSLAFAVVAAVSVAFAVEDVTVPVRPGDPSKGVPFWNDYATIFRYAPAFSFAPVEGAARYRFTVANGPLKKSFEAATPYAALSPIWRDLPNRPGYTVTCEGVGADGKVVGKAGERAFTKTAAFEEVRTPPRVRSYREAARMIYEYITALPAMRTLVETGKPEQTYQHNAYVSKTHAAHINSMLDWAKSDPANRERAMRFAKASAELLLGELEPPSAPLAHWPPTYGRKPLECDPAKVGKRPAMVGNEPEGAVKYRREVMLLYPADVGAAFVRYGRVTGDGRFLAAARGIADTYLKVRRADGSWPLKMVLATGETVGRNTLVPTRVMTFLEALGEATGEARYTKAADECFGFLENDSVKTMNWDGQFEDVEPRPPYQDLTKHNAIEAMFQLLRRYPGDAAKLAVARDLLRFSEDQFVFWEAPCKPGESIPSPGPNARNGSRFSPGRWDYPSVFEQYSCYIAIDASARKLVRAYLAMWRAATDPLDLAKAKALCDSITRVQKPSGRVPTFWSPHEWLGTETYDWLNCMESAAAALVECAEAVGEE